MDIFTNFNIMEMWETHDFAPEEAQSHAIKQINLAHINVAKLIF